MPCLGLYFEFATSPRVILTLHGPNTYHGHLFEHHPLRHHLQVRLSVRNAASPSNLVSAVVAPPAVLGFGNVGMWTTQALTAHGWRAYRPAKVKSPQPYQDL